MTSIQRGVLRCIYAIYESYVSVCLLCVATFTLHTIWFDVYRYVFAVLYLHQCFVLHNSCTHCATVLLCRIPHRGWLKVSAGSYDTSLLPSSPMKQAEGGREMEGEVVFRRDTKSNLLKAVSGTEWMYRRGALERGRRVSVPAACLVCVSAYT